MLLAKLKPVTAIALAVALAGAGAGLLRPPARAQAQDAKAPPRAAPAADAPAVIAINDVTIRGLNAQDRTITVVIAKRGATPAQVAVHRASQTAAGAKLTAAKKLAEISVLDVQMYQTLVAAAVNKRPEDAKKAAADLARAKAQYEKAVADVAEAEGELGQTFTWLENLPLAPDVAVVVKGRAASPADLRDGMTASLRLTGGGDQITVTRIAVE